MGERATITVRGHSDDCLIVEGGGFLEEFHPADETRGHLAFSDGTLLGVRYDGDGMWRIDRLAAGSAAYAKAEATDPDDEYSDVVTLDGPISWALFGEAFARAAGSEARRA